MSSDIDISLGEGYLWISCIQRSKTASVDPRQLRSLEELDREVFKQQATPGGYGPADLLQS